MFRHNRRSKHNNQKREIDGYICDSWAESAYYEQELKPRLERGEITNFEFHPSYEIVPGHRNTPSGKKERARVYEADFSYVEVRTGQIHIIDVKGFSDALYRFKINLWRYKYPDLAKCYRTVDAKLYKKPRTPKVPSKEFSSTP